MALDISVLSLIVIGLTEAIKRGFEIPKRLIPLVAIALAIFIGGTSGFIGLTDLSFTDAIIAGLVSCGLWSGVKNTIQKSIVIPPQQ